MSYISINSGVGCTYYGFCNKAEEEEMRDCEVVKTSVKMVRRGYEKYKDLNYTRLINGTSNEQTAYRLDAALVDSGRLLLDFDYKDSKLNRYMNVDKIFRPHIDEWGVVHMEESVRGGAHITVRKIEGLTNSQIVRLFELRTGLTIDKTGVNLCKMCFLVPNDMVHYVNDEYYYSLCPTPLLPLSDEDKALLEEDARQKELEHQAMIQTRLASAQIYTSSGDEASEIDDLVNMMDKAGVQVDDYHEWIVLGLVIAYIKGEAGRVNFHILSRNSCKYSCYECDRTYTYLIHSARGEVTLGTLKWFAKKEGVIV